MMTERNEDPPEHSSSTLLGVSSTASLPLVPPADGEYVAPFSHNHSPANGEHTNPWKNRNVRLSLALCISEGIADSIWSAVVLSGFLYALGIAMGKTTSDNTLVGAAEAVQGISQLVFALPIGILADTYGKARIVAYGGGLMLLATASSLWAVTDAVHSVDSVSDATRAYRWFLVALALWGISGGVVNGPSQALFADSIQKGKRSELFTWL